MKKKTEKMEYNEIFIYNAGNGTNLKNATEYDMIVNLGSKVVTIKKDEIYNFDSTLDITKIKIEFDHHIEEAQ